MLTVVNGTSPGQVDRTTDSLLDYQKKLGRRRQRAVYLPPDKTSTIKKKHRKHLKTASLFLPQSSPLLISII